MVEESTNATLKREFLRAIGSRLSNFGFPKRPRGQTFYRKNELGSDAVHFSFIEHEFGVDVTTDVAVRLDDVEDMINADNKLLSKKEKADTFTLGVELGNLERGEPYRVRLAHASDVGPAVERSMNRIAEIGIPYLARYSSLKSALTVLSEDDKSAWLHCPVHLSRAMSACAALVSLGKYSELASLAEKKRAYLQSIQDPGLSRFDKFIDAVTKDIEGQKTDDRSRYEG